MSMDDCTGERPGKLLKTPRAAAQSTVTFVGVRVVALVHLESQLLLAVPQLRKLGYAGLACIGT